MDLIASIDKDRRCRVGKMDRDEQFVFHPNVNPKPIKNSDKLSRLSYMVGSERIVSEYLKTKPRSITFIYRVMDVQKFFEAECANKQLLAKTGTTVLSVENQFDLFLELAKMDKSKMPKVKFTEMRRAFYAGFGQALTVMSEDIGTIQEEELAINAVETLLMQIENFWLNEQPQN